MVGSGTRRVAALALVVVLAAACGGGGGGGSSSRLANPGPPAETDVFGLTGPEGLCFDSNGNLYVGSTTGRITRITPDGFPSVFAETGRSLAGLATGPQDEIFAAAFNTGEVVAVSQDGVMRIATSGLDGPNGIVFDSAQRLLVSAFGLGGNPQIVLVEFDGTSQTLTQVIRSPNGMAFGRDGLLYVADTFMNRIVRMTQDEAGDLGEPEVYASGIGFPDGIAFDEDGDLFVGAAGQVWVVVADEDPPIRPFVTSGDLNGPASLAFGSGTGRDRSLLYFTNNGFPVLGSGTTVGRVDVGIPGLRLFAP